jgi:Spy/CpxP family protein refolding chaperone
MTDDSASRRTRSRLLALGLLVLAFVAGALGGVAADRLLAPGEPAGRRVAGPPGRGGPGAAIFPRDLPLARQLDLTPEQREQIEAILREERAKADSVLRAVRPVLQARYDSASAAIRAVLTPEQRDRFDRFREGRRERMRPRRMPR